MALESRCFVSCPFHQIHSVLPLIVVIPIAGFKVKGETNRVVVSFKRQISASQISFVDGAFSIGYVEIIRTAISDRDVSKLERLAESCDLIVIRSEPSKFIVVSKGVVAVRGKQTICRAILGLCCWSRPRAVVTRFPMLA